MPDVSRALSRFRPRAIVWVSRFRTKDDWGQIKTTAERSRVSLSGVVTEANYKTLMLMQDGSVGSVTLDCYFKGAPKTPEGAGLEIEDTFYIDGYGEQDFRVRMLFPRFEGGYTKATVRAVTRREVQP